MQCTIQAVYDLISGQLIEFSIDPYSKNDLTAAPELELREGDLVLRDRGYIIAAEMQRHCDVGAHFIYRHKTGMTYLDVETGQPIDLPPSSGAGNWTWKLSSTTRERTRVRLLAASVSRKSPTSGA